MLRASVVIAILLGSLSACGGSNGTHCQSGAAGTQCYNNGYQQNSRPTNNDPPPTTSNPMPAR